MNWFSNRVEGFARRPLRLGLHCVAGLCLMLTCGTFPTEAGIRSGKFFFEWRDAKTKKPIPKASIQILPLSPGQGITLETDDKGRAGHLTVPEGVYRVVCTKDGYASVEVTNVLVEDHFPVRLFVNSLDAESAPYKVKQVRYERPTVDVETNGLKTVFRNYNSLSLSGG